MAGRIKSGFSIGAVTTPDELYGWNQAGDLLDKLLTRVENGTSFLLYGERRSGKTSLLNCLITKLREDILAPFPVLIDFQRLPNFKGCGTEKGYTYIVQEISKCLQDYLEKYSWSFEFKFLYEGMNIFELHKLSRTFSADECRHILEEIEKFFKSNNKSLVIIFDEYEHLARVFNDNETFFYPFRSLQDKYNSHCGGIFCVIAGAESTQNYSIRTGSPQFNLFTDKVSVPPLNIVSFAALWSDCRTNSSPLAQENIDSQETDIKKIYNLCGGRPAFAKRIGHAWALDGKEAVENPLEDWLENIFTRQPEISQETLLSIVLDKPISESLTCLHDLLDLHLIKKNDEEIGGYSINGLLWKSYIKKRSLQTFSKPIIRHAGDLAKRILKDNKISELLELRKGKGELDWLEYKTCLIPNSKQQSIDQENSKKQYHTDDYIWHVVKSIIALRNSRGGLVLIGIADNGDIIGLERRSNYTTDEEFLRKEIWDKLSKKEFKIEHKKKINLNECNWNIDAPSNNWFYCKSLKIMEKYIVALAIQPDNTKDYPVIIEMPVENPRNYITKYALIRNKSVSTEEIKEETKYKEHQEQMKLIQNDDLLEFLEELLSV